MSNLVTITAKVPREIKEEAKRLGINISEVVRRALIEEINRRKLEEIKKRKMRLKQVLERISDERVVKTIREMRDSN